jgi:hypothetical protein
MKQLREHWPLLAAATLLILAATLARAQEYEITGTITAQGNVPVNYPAQIDGAVGDPATFYLTISGAQVTDSSIQIIPVWYNGIATVANGALDSASQSIVLSRGDMGSTAVYESFTFNDAPNTLEVTLTEYPHNGAAISFVTDIGNAVASMVTPSAHALAAPELDPNWWAPALTFLGCAIAVMMAKKWP